MQSRRCVLFHHLLLGALALLCSDTAAEVPADCAHDGKTYRPGEAFSPDVCTHCVCPRTGGPNADCFKTRCPGPLYHRGCIKWEAVKGSCCQRCVARGCRVGNASYPFGALVPTSDPCLKCQCSAQLPHGDIVCMAVMCAMPPCVDRRRREGECCETCPNGKYIAPFTLVSFFARVELD